MASENDNSEGLSGASKAFGFVGSSNFEEEQPTMRAVAVTGQAPFLQFGSSIDGPTFNKAPPSGISRSPPVVRRSASLAVKKVWTEENWKITDRLEQLPEYFPLERTHREIHGASANEVALRISTALRLLSVDAEFDCEKAKAKCTTNDCVSFRIRLFAGGEEGLPVIVEVQRRNGHALSFMRVCRKILDAADGSEIQAEIEPARKIMPPFMKSPICNMKCLQGMPTKMDREATLNTDLEKCMELLRSKQKDTNILGLENLCHLTDPLKTRPDFALKACKAIMLEPKCVDIREELGVMLQKDAFLPEEFDNEGALNLHHQARHMSLVLLSNALVLTGKDGCLTDAVKSRKWFTEFLIPSLLDEVKGFESSANNAYEAACGLTSLATCSEIARRVMVENSAVDDLLSAYMYGTVNHELLANESERALNALGHNP